MAKRCKLRIYRVIATTFQSCRSKDPSNLPQDPVPSFPPLPKFSTLHFSLPEDQAHISSAFISIRRASPSVDDGPTALPPPSQFKWQKEQKWHIIAPRPRLKIYNSSDDSDADADADNITFAPPPPFSAERNRRRSKKKKNVPTKLRLSTSSADSGWFSSEGGTSAAAAAEIDEEETETLVSSSSENVPHRRRSRRRSVSKRITKRGGLRPSPPPPSAAEGETPARLSVFKKLIPCAVDGKVKESFAVVKRSEDPYEDFKNSMMDMIVEKQMFEERDLEQLLQCFLSLNSRDYHGIIVEAFSEIWEGIFSPAGSKSTSGHGHRRVSKVATFET